MAVSTTPIITALRSGDIEKAKKLYKKIKASLTEGNRYYIDNAIAEAVKKAKKTKAKKK